MDSTFIVIPIDLPLHIKQVILSVSSLNLFLLFDLMFLTLFILSLVILMYGCYLVYLLFITSAKEVTFLVALVCVSVSVKMIPQKVLNILQ